MPRGPFHACPVIRQPPQYPANQNMHSPSTLAAPLYAYAHSQYRELQHGAIHYTPCKARQAVVSQPPFPNQTYADFGNGCLCCHVFALERHPQRGVVGQGQDRVTPVGKLQPDRAKLGATLAHKLIPLLHLIMRRTAKKHEKNSKDRLKASFHHKEEVRLSGVQAAACLFLSTRTSLLDGSSAKAIETPPIAWSLRFPR